VDTATIDEAFAMDTCKGSDGGHSCHRIPQLEWLHQLELLGSGMCWLHPIVCWNLMRVDYATILAVLPELSAAHTRGNYDPVHSHVHRWYFVQLFRCSGRWQNALGDLCRYGSIRRNAMLTLTCLCRLVTGTLLTASGGILFALIDPSVTYWAFSFPSTVLIVFGADFVYSCGTLFIASVVLPHEHSVGGALFQTMTQVRGCANIC